MSIKSLDKYRIFLNLTSEEAKLIIDIYLYDRLTTVFLAHKFYFSRGKDDIRTARSTTYRRLNKLCERKVLKKVLFMPKTENENIYVLDRIGLFCVINLLGLSPNLYDNDTLIEKNHRTLGELEISKKLYHHQIATIYTRLATEHYVSKNKLNTYDLLGYSNKYSNTLKIPDLYYCDSACSHRLCIEVDMGSESSTFMRSSLSNYLSQISYFYNQNPHTNVSILFILTNTARIPLSREYLLDLDENDLLSKDLPYIKEHKKYLSFIATRKTMVQKILLEVLGPVLLDRCNLYIHELIEFSNQSSAGTLDDIFYNKKDIEYLHTSLVKLYRHEQSKGVDNEIIEHTLKLGTNSFYCDLAYRTKVNMGTYTLPAYLLFFDFTTNNLQSIARALSALNAMSYISNIAIYPILIVNDLEQINCALELIKNNKLNFMLKDQLITSPIESCFLQYESGKLLRRKLSLAF